MEINRIGVIACSGEECLGGTISRLAVRKMMEELKPGMVSTLCLPLFIAGDGGEREFARNYPTIAVDGCSKCCAKRAIEKYSNTVAGLVDIEVLLGADKALEKPLSTRHLTDEHRDYVDRTAAEIVAIFDGIQAKSS